MTRAGTPSHDELTLTTLRPDDLPDLLDLLQRCSPTTLFRRFHGPTDGVAYMRRLARGDHEGETVVARNGKRCVGVASLAGSGAEMELGVLVEDAWQRRRVGTKLVGHLVEWARTGDISAIRADVLGEDRFIVRALSRIGDVEVTCESGVYKARVTLG